MEQFKTFVNTSENINPVVKVEFTMDCKVIYGFDLSLSKRFTVCSCLLSESRDKLNGNMLWFRVSPRWVLVKTTYGRKGMGVEIGFMINKILVFQLIIFNSDFSLKLIWAFLLQENRAGITRLNTFFKPMLSFILGNKMNILQ